MTDPVDTDVLREVSKRLAGVHVRGPNLAVVRARGELEAAADELDRLRAIVAESPSHARVCAWHATHDGLDCTCWKAGVL